MAVVNQYKFYGKATTAAETVSMLSPAVNETFIINTQQLATSTSVEILTLPLIVEGGTILKYITAGTVSDGVDIGISYLNIKKEVTT